MQDVARKVRRNVGPRAYSVMKFILRWILFYAVDNLLATRVCTLKTDRKSILILESPALTHS